MMTAFVCTNCGYWQRVPGRPAACAVCLDFRHSPPEGGFRFLSSGEAEETVDCRWSEDANGVTTFHAEPGLGIGPKGYLIRLAGGNLLFENTPWWSEAALKFLELQGGVRWVSASHPHAYGALWRVQERFRPEVIVQVEDLPWTRMFAVSLPFDDRLEIAPGVTMLHTGGHFAGHAVLHWAERGILFAGDMLKFHFDSGAVSGISTHKAFLPRTPMTHAEIRRYRAVVEPLAFTQTYTTFEHAPHGVGTRETALGLFDTLLARPPFFGPVPLQ